MGNLLILLSFTDVLTTSALFLFKSLFVTLSFSSMTHSLKQDEWTGEQKLQYSDIPEDIEPEDIRPMGNYAVSITWPDGFSQVIFYLMGVL